MPARVTKTPFLSDTEREVFRREWEATRKNVLELTKGRTILLVDCPPARKATYREELGFISRSKVGKGKGITR